MIVHYSKNIQNVIQKELFKAQKNIKIAVAWFTNDLLFQPLLMKLQTGVSVEIILNKDEINDSEDNEVDFDEFVKLGGILRWNTAKQLLHDKFCIIDENVVITGSYNWTNKAEYNRENISVFTQSGETSKFYLGIFNEYANLFECCIRPATISQEETILIDNSQDNAVNERVSSYNVTFLVEMREIRKEYRSKVILLDELAQSFLKFAKKCREEKDEQEFDMLIDVAEDLVQEFELANHFPLHDFSYEGFESLSNNGYFNEVYVNKIHEKYSRSGKWDLEYCFWPKNAGFQYIKQIYGLKFDKRYIADGWTMAIDPLDESSKTPVITCHTPSGEKGSFDFLRYHDESLHNNQYVFERCYLVDEVSEENSEIQFNSYSAYFMTNSEFPPYKLTVELDNKYYRWIEDKNFLSQDYPIRYIKFHDINMDFMEVTRNDDGFFSIGIRHKRKDGLWQVIHVINKLGDINKWPMEERMSRLIKMLNRNGSFEYKAIRCFDYYYTYKSEAKPLTQEQKEQLRTIPLWLKRLEISNRPTKINTKFDSQIEEKTETPFQRLRSIINSNPPAPSYCSFCEHHYIYRIVR